MNIFKLLTNLRAAPCILGLLLSMSAAHAALELELTQGIDAALPISVTVFNGENSQDSNRLTAVMSHDLQLSGRFRLATPLAQKIQWPGSASALQSWSAAGIDYVVAGTVMPLDAHRVSVSYQLLQSAGSKHILLNRQFKVDTKQLRRLAHHISDEIYQELTGDKGVFSTRITYVVVQHFPKAPARYFLEVADFDGSNPQQLLKSSHPIMSPAWSPDGREIAYVSFERERAQIFKVPLASGARQLLTSFPGINGAPTFSPDGKKMAIVLSKSGSPKIYLVDLISRQIQKLTTGNSIDTEPRFTPNGQGLVFTSNRGGGPQIYHLDLKTDAVERLTFNGPYNARASLTPDGSALVMLHREDGMYNIALQNLSTGELTNLTNSGQDDSPSLSPNGKLVLYGTHYGNNGILSIVSIDGRVRLRLPSRDGDVQEPAWSPYIT